MSDAYPRTLKESLARFMDPQAFMTGVPDAVKFTCKEVGRVQHDKLKHRRETALKRADAAIRFFMKPENRERLDYRARAASCDTHPQGGDEGNTSAPFMSGAVPPEEAGDAQTPPSESPS